MLKILILAFVLCHLLHTTFAWPPLYEGSYFSDITSDLLLGPNTGFRPVAVADWNNDNFMDLLVVTESNFTFMVYLWDTGNHSYYAHYRSFISPQYPIVGIVAADINRDGLVDALIQHAGGNVHVVYGDGGKYNLPHHHNKSNPQKPIAAGTVQLDILPLPIVGSVANVNLLVMLGLCAAPDLAATLQNGSIAIFTNSINFAQDVNCNYYPGPVEFLNVTAVPAQYTPILGSYVATDVDGDCMADFVYAERVRFNHTFRYKLFTDHSSDAWRNEEQERKDFAKGRVKYFEVPEFVGAGTWEDVDMDGTVDVSFPSCVMPLERPVLLSDTTRRAGDGGEAFLNSNPSWEWYCPEFDAVLTVFNNIRGGSVCPGDNCCRGHFFSFPSILNFTQLIDTPPNAYFSQFSLSSGACNSAHNRTTILENPMYPARLRFTDYNDDALNDIVIASSRGPMTLTGNGRKGNARASFACQLLPVPGPALRMNDSSFFTSIPFFIDFNEDGKQDVMTASQNGRSVYAFWNGNDNSANYFINFAMLNGVGGPNGYPAWGATQVGGVHRFAWPDMDNHMRFASSTQLSQSQFSSLNSPKSHFGLSKTFSYIQNYASGVFIRDHSHYETWTVYLMPNSQVFVLASPITDANRWEIKMYLPESRYKQLVLISFVVSLAVIGLPIAFLRYREFLQDRQDAKKNIS